MKLRVIGLALALAAAGCTGSDDTSTPSDDAPETTSEQATSPTSDDGSITTSGGADAISSAGFGCEDFATLDVDSKVPAEASGECSVSSGIEGATAERARIDVYTDDAQLAAALQGIADMGFGVTTIVECDRWTVTVDTAEMATALAAGLADSLDCAVLT